MKDTSILNHGILNGIKDLETGLHNLGYDGNIISVCHSYGGFYSTLLAARHPNNVKYVVRLDASLVAAFTDDNLKTYHSFMVDKTRGLGLYFETINFKHTIMIMRQIEFPQNIPVIDIIAGIPYHAETNEQIKEFEQAHVNFVNGNPNRQLIKATGSTHDIKYDNPNLVINAIIKAFASTIDEKQKTELLTKSLDNTMELANQTKAYEKTYVNSVNNLNDLGYSYMENNDLQKALDVFKLNVSLYPNDWNVYDSYGEALLKANHKAEAIKMYKKSIELNPNNDNGKEILEKLSRTK